MPLVFKNNDNVVVTTRQLVQQSAVAQQLKNSYQKSVLKRKSPIMQPNQLKQTYLGMNQQNYDRESEYQLLRYHKQSSSQSPTPNTFAHFSVNDFLQSSDKTPVFGQCYEESQLSRVLPEHLLLSPQKVVSQSPQLSVQQSSNTNDSIKRSSQQRMQFYHFDENNDQQSVSLNQLIQENSQKAWGILNRAPIVRESIVVNNQIDQGKAKECEQKVDCESKQEDQDSDAEVQDLIPKYDQENDVEIQEQAGEELKQVEDIQTEEAAKYERTSEVQLQSNDVKVDQDKEPVEVVEANRESQVSQSEQQGSVVSQNNLDQPINLVAVSQEITQPYPDEE